MYNILKFYLVLKVLKLICAVFVCWCYCHNKVLDEVLK